MNGSKAAKCVTWVQHVRVAVRHSEPGKDQTFDIQNKNALHGRFRELIRTFVNFVRSRAGIRRKHNN